MFQVYFLKYNKRCDSNLSVGSGLHVREGILEDKVPSESFPGHAPIV